MRISGSDQIYSYLSLHDSLLHHDCYIEIGKDLRTEYQVSELVEFDRCVFVELVVYR